LTPSAFPLALRAVLVAAIPAAAWGCSSTDNGTIQIITDEEAGTFTKNPAPTQLQIIAVESADASTVLATAPLSATTIDLGNLSESASPVSINVRGLDGTGALRAFGATLPVSYAGMAGQTIPVFVQRSGEFARLPGPLADARTAPTLGFIQGEYLLVAGGGASAATASTTQIFDFAAFAALAAPPTLPVVPQSMAFYGTIAWLVNASGATYFDFSSSGSLAIAMPPGGTFADVAGGVTLSDADGAQYIVGATRTTGAPTRSVLKIDPNDASDTNYPYGKPTWLTLTTARLGAAAAWVSGRGIVVAGGQPEGSAPTVDIIGPSAVTATSVPYAVPNAVGAGMTPLDTQHVLLAGGVSTATLGDPGVLVLDLGCAPSATMSCVTPWAGLPAGAGPLASAQTFSWAPTEALVVGNELGTGATHVYRVSASTATEVPTRVAHHDARAAWSPVGTIVLFGGSNVLESFTP
jgi:hypothetical protein